ncbi:MAG TPA: hypothetical protein VN700_01325 [Vicinamibacterales bacterium]|nr:hypothetical protein [Vicinamibacterales bacterium]
MSSGKTIALTLGFLGTFALGVWVSPHVRPSLVGEPEPVMQTASAPAPAPEPDRTAARVRASEDAMVLRPIAASTVELQRLLKPVLNEGMNLKMASDGFRDGEQFAAVAHAARNLGIPFMVLKQRVLEEKMTLAAAIREIKPDVNAALEANRARIQARADIAAITL